MNVPMKVTKIGAGEVIEPDVDGFVFKPPLCVFCNAPWTADVITVEAEAEMYHGYYGDTSVERINTTIDITCSTCKRLVYRKELREIPYTGGW